MTSLKKKKILFLTLKIFSATGGIEKVCRIAGKALNEISAERNNRLLVSSMYDAQSDAENNRYFPSSVFKGFNASKTSFMFSAVKEGLKSDIVIISHVNLLPAAWLIHFFSPSAKIVLLAHGIEIWKPLSRLKRKMLGACDLILPVSRFTRDKIVELQHISSEKCVVLNNALDPFLPLPLQEKDPALIEKYRLEESSFVLLSLTRLAATERHKGYDKVIEAVAAINNTGSRKLVYIIAGKYTEDEKAFIEHKAVEAGISEQVILTGFVPDEELAAYFKLADMYVMPSKKEGFGIVFIEAAYYGLPVLGGNEDGTADALLDGKLGQLTETGNVDKIREAIVNVMQDKGRYLPDHNMLMEHFSFERYKNNLKNIINTHLN